jgi:hypothetical protein
MGMRIGYARVIPSGQRLCATARLTEIESSSKRLLPPPPRGKSSIEREMRYEIQESTIYVLRLWHTRENR